MTPSNDDKFQFLGSHRPALTDGDYRITVSITEAAAPARLWSESPSRSAEFSVAGDRFTVHPAVLRSCFPPPSARGDFTGVLPHLIFHRSTFPWERPPEAPELPDTHPEERPWLALLVFAEEDIPAVKTVRADSLLAEPPPDAPAVWRVRSRERCDDGDAAVSVIDLDATALKKAAPTWPELPYTAHVRKVTFAGSGSGEVAGDDADSLDGGDTSEAETAGSPDTQECAVVVAQRFLRPRATATRWVVHLVSLEGAYDSTTFGFAPKGSSKAHAAAQVRLVSLFHWEFVCEAAAPDFEGTVSVLVPAPFRLPADRYPVAPDPRATTLLDRGSVPLPHRLREGGSMVSWYRGPLMPWAESADPSVRLPLPARSSDALNRYEPALGMMDTSYAVAWELGRLTALADHAFSTRLSQWKRARASAAARLRVELDADLLPHPALESRPAPVRLLAPELLGFLDGLATLRSVPPTHLVPHPLLLPAEAIRVVRIDTTWVECLLDGALSIGRHSAHEAGRDAHLPVGPARGLLGVLVRSRVVEEHPDLEIHGWDKAREVGVGVVLDRKLGVGVRLVLFESDPATITLGLPPTVLHFGVHVNGENVKVRRRSADSAANAVEEKELVKDTHWDDNDRLHLDTIATKLGVGVADLLESAPIVSFDLAAGSAR